MVQTTDGDGDVESGEKKRVREVKAQPPVRVRTVHSEKKVVLVEWAVEGILHRATLPVGSVEFGMVAADILAQAIPYGKIWEDENFPPVDIKALANELRREGIWTEEDLLRRTDLVRAAAQRAYINPLINQLIDKYRR